MGVILIAIPFFFLLIAIELVVDWRRGTGYYRLNDAINSLSLGLVSRLAGIAKAAVPIAMYVSIYQHFALLQWPVTPQMWLVAFVIYDFFYYWNHRMGHETNLFWSSHVVHHSSEEYNLTTALRQTSGTLFNWVFFVPLALLGVSPAMFVTIAAINLVYQFWVHTRHIKTLGWLEWIMITPSNHRVHHAQNEIYLDKNYGGVFIVWDRLFGTFQEELDDEPPVYGVRKPLKSWNPLWANLQVYTQVGKDCWRTARWQDKIAIWFKPPSWRPADVAASDPIELDDLNDFKKFDLPLSSETKSYVLLQYLLNTILVLVLLLNIHVMSGIIQTNILLWLLLSSVSLGWVMENRSFSLPLEWLKQAILLIALTLFSVPFWLQWVLAFIGLISLIWALRLHQQRANTPNLHQVF